MKGKMAEHRENGLADPENIITVPGIRITVLTERMVRFEFQQDNYFCDECTQKIVRRDFPENNYTVNKTDEEIEIVTSYLKINCKLYNPKLENVRVEIYDEHGRLWGIYAGGELNDKYNLKGTARTLDGADGAIPLEEGLFSQSGYGVINDSNSCTLTNGFIKVREYAETDLYLFGYCDDYYGGLKDFYYLCGEAPLFPKYMLGNWWSRYYPYSEQEYEDLLNHFDEENIPLTVAVLDMDWHTTDVPEELGGGWTGYTWNKELFPQPELFLKKLHRRGLRVTLNVHPALGIRSHECMYEDMARELGVETESRQPIEFDMTDKRFVKAYFKWINHPYEEMGVDFWWIDWQQGKESKIENLDPLWLLNHFYYEDAGRDGRRPAIFSRYAGIGSHRNPIGFSGDSIASWESLKFQPYFTANAANVGYGCWSHDICGHMLGRKSNDMFVRWLQFGVFSPIMRLHSSSGVFFHKEPWNIPLECREIMGTFMRLRHKMIPYIYTENYANYCNGRPLIVPMYYRGKEKESYEYPNQYCFGSQMIVCPITTPLNEKLQLGSVEGWLPKGKYTDFFTGMCYEGGKHTFFRNASSIPVFIKQGAIIPMYTDDQGNRIDNPEKLEIRLYFGADGKYTLYEDDGISEEYKDGKFALTDIEMHWGECTEIKVEVKKNAVGILPQMRGYVFIICGVTRPEKVYDSFGKKSWTYDENRRELSIETGLQAVSEPIKIFFQGCRTVGTDVLSHCYRILDEAFIEYEVKEKIYTFLEKNMTYRGKEEWNKIFCDRGADQNLVDVLWEFLQSI